MKISQNDYISGASRATDLGVDLPLDRGVFLPPASDRLPTGVARPETGVLLPGAGDLASVLLDPGATPR